MESSWREKKDLQKQLLAYIKTTPTCDGLKVQRSEKARKAYRGRLRRQEIEIYYSFVGRVELPDA